MDDEIATKTLAELYLNQGNERKALEIYHQILKREPSNSEVREAIKNLERRIAQSSEGHGADPSHDSPRVERVRNLEKWLENIRLVRRQRKNRESL